MDTTALFKLGYGLYVIGTELDGAAAGCTANTVMQITSEPAQIAVGLNKNNYTNEMIQKSGKLTVSILDKTADMNLIGNFGFSEQPHSGQVCQQWPGSGEGCFSGALSGGAYQRRIVGESGEYFGLRHSYVVVFM